MDSEKSTGKVLGKKKRNYNKSIGDIRKVPAIYEDLKIKSSKKTKKQITFEDIEQKIFDKDNCYSEKLKSRHRPISINERYSSANELDIKLKESLLRPKKIDQSEVNNLISLKKQSCLLRSAKRDISNGNVLMTESELNKIDKSSDDLSSHRPKKIDLNYANNLNKLKKQSSSLLSAKRDISNAKNLKTKSKINKVDKSSNDLSLSHNCKSRKLNKPSKPICKMPIASSESYCKTNKKDKGKVSKNINRPIVKRDNKSKNNPPKTVNVNDSIKYESSSESGASDWENVDELFELDLINQKESLKKNENITIELKQENILWGYKKRKRRSEQDLIEDYLRKQVNKSIREVYENMHKCHVLCLFAHGRYVNEVVTSQNLIATSMSLIPKNYFTPKRFDLSHLEKFVKWFCKHIDMKQKNLDTASVNHSLEDILSERILTKSAQSNKELVLLFVLISRSIGMDVRLVFSFYPISWKPSIDCLIKPKREESEDLDELNVDKVSASLEASTSNNNSNNSKNKFSRKMISDDSDDEIQLKPIKNNESSDLEFEPNKKNIKAPKKVSKLNDKCGTKRKSRDGDEQIKKIKREVLGEWAEVYVEEEEKWISVDVTRGSIHCASEIEARSPSNTAYVVAYHADHTVKDVTKRYISSWLSKKEKIRCDGMWWDASLKPFLGPKTRKDKNEDKELDQNLRLQPLPKILAEYKNHPLYALQKHLLKFEAIYPPNPSPLGFFRGEAVYSRECVKTLSRRENWIREGKEVRVGEEPYKIVKALPKWDKGLGQLLKDRPLELFGEWQVEDYQPPIAKNGKVPRNEYGNVELFKPSMIPIGCIHLPIPGLARLARKLEIDCAPALVGFEYHKGACHPLNDGFVICEEFKDILLDAWTQEQMEQVKREEEKKLKRIYNNWKRLIRGMILKKRIKETYGNKNKQVESNCEEKKDQENTIEKTKLKIEEANLSVPKLITHPVINLQIDYNSCISSMAKQKKQTIKEARRIQKALITKDKKGTINNERNKSLNELALSDDSDASVDISRKQEKIRKILEWNPDKGVGRSNPNLSDDSDKETSNMETPRSLPCSAQVKKKCKLIKHKKIKSHCEKDRQISTSEESSTGDLEEVTVNPTKRLSLRSRGKKKILYTERDAVASDISIDDSDIEDKTFVPVNKKPVKFNLDLSDESS